MFAALPDQRHWFIEQWRTSVSNAHLNHKRECVNSYPEAPAAALEAILSTPPASQAATDSGLGSSPPKNRKIIPYRSSDNDHHEDVFVDPHQTPRGNSTLFRSNAPALPPPSVASSATPRSSAASGSRASTTSRTTGGRRPTSPTKMSLSLVALRKPVTTISLEDSPENYLTMSPGCTNGIFPAAAKEEISKALKKTLPASFFRDSHDDDDDDPAVAEDLLIQHGREKRNRALAELALLQQIKTRAVECCRLGESEASWNLDVHGKLLEHALHGFGGRVRRLLVTSAGIAKPFVPETNDYTAEQFAEKKMVDFAIVLNIGEVDGAHNNAQEEEEARFGSLGRDIRRVVQSQPMHCRTINQTTYAPLCYKPVGVSIETKVSGVASEGRAQLATWAAAWHRRMELLTTATTAGAVGEGGKGRRVVTLPLVLITEHDWNLSFACDMGNRVAVMGAIKLGDTQSLKGIYMLVAAVRELGRWIEGPFSQWMSEMVAER